MRRGCAPGSGPGEGDTARRRPLPPRIGEEAGRYVTRDRAIGGGAAEHEPATGEAERRPAFGGTERDSYAGASVTTLAAYPARHLPHLLDAPAEGGQPAVWLEHDPPGRGVPGEYDRVTFAPWRIRAAWLGGTLRRALGTPAWTRLDRAGVAALLGPPAPRAGGR